MSGTFQSPRPESDSPYSRPDSSSGPSTNDQEHGDTQRSLQQASVALEVAYNRIRQVRRSLMELSESLPSTDGLPRFSMNFNEFEPGHEALLLAGDRFEAERELSRGFDASTTFTLPHIPPVVNLPNVERSTSTGDAQGVNEALLNRMDTDSILFQPLLSPNVLPPRFSRREHSNDMQYFQRPGITYDPASTLRGLRVAAREAQAREVQGLHAERRVLRETAIDSMLHTNGGSSRVERQNHLGRGTESLDSRRMAHSPPLPTAPPAWRAPDPRRWRIRPELRVNHRPSGVDVPDRFLTLSTMMNTPHSTDMSRNVPGLPLSTETIPTSAFERYHFYQEGMRLEDMASNINIDWSDDDFVSWLFPAQESNLLPPRERQQTDTQPNPEIIRITRTTDTAESPPESSPPRRGWGMLQTDLYFTRSHIFLTQRASMQMVMKYRQMKKKSWSGHEQRIGFKLCSDPARLRLEIMQITGLLEECSKTMVVSEMHMGAYWIRP